MNAWIGTLTRLSAIGKKKQSESLGPSEFGRRDGIDAFGSRWNSQWRNHADLCLFCFVHQRDKKLKSSVPLREPGGVTFGCCLSLSFSQSSLLLRKLTRCSRSLTSLGLDF